MCGQFFVSEGGSGGSGATAPRLAGLPSGGPGERVRIALAEDNPGDVFLVREALRSHAVEAELLVHADGEEMLRFVERVELGVEPCPDLVLLDLNLPKRSGEVLLKRIREGRVCTRIPVVIVTSSDSPRDRETTARLGANSYFRKPADFDEFLQLGALVKRVIGGDVRVS